MSSNKPRRLWIVIVPVLLVGCIAVASAMRGKTDVQQDAAPTVTPDTSQTANGDPDVAPKTRDSSIAEVLDLARSALGSMENSLVDYTAHFIQQDRSETGELNERSEMDVKIQTRLRNETNDAPMRIYLKFRVPEANAGREVIWGKDLYDGQLAVHETSVLLSWKTIWLDPTGMLAMAGQKYPIYEIGITKLVEKLIERGLKDVDNPDVTVTVTRDHEYDGKSCELIQAKRAKPSGDDEDFSLAEIIYDPERMLILSYRSFGWREGDNKDTPLPLLESYEYRDLKTNVGLTDTDFDVANPEYGYPK